MKQPIIASILLAATAAASPRALREHVDIHWNHDGEDGWTCLAKTEAEGDDVFEELDEVYLAIDDAPIEADGQRYLQPEGEEYAFTGVAPGGPVWIASQIQQPGQCWPGFNSYQATGVFGAYQETDIRLSGDDRSLAIPWIKVTLEEVSYQGSGSGSFALWQEDSSGSPTVWFSTSDNTHPDTYLFAAGSHQHLNWGFGSPGIYQIRLSASAYLGPGQTNPTGPSDTFTVTFAVGSFAQWQAENFGVSQLEDAGVCGPAADPDKDGLGNLLEYAFGSHPLGGGRSPVASGLGLPVFTLGGKNGIIYQTLTYPRRKSGARLDPEVYQPLFADSPAGPWSDAGVETTISEFPPSQAGLNTDWELVTSRRPIPSGASSGIGRVAVTAGDAW
jgi:surface-anchored protein